MVFFPSLGDAQAEEVYTQRMMMSSHVAFLQVVVQQDWVASGCAQ